MRFVDALVRRSRLFRAVEADLVRSAEARDRAIDERDRLLARVEDLVSDRDKARADATDAARKVADWMALRTFGAPVFDRTMTFEPISESTRDAAIRATPVHGRDHVINMTRQFMEDCKRNAETG